MTRPKEQRSWIASRLFFLTLAVGTLPLALQTILWLSMDDGLSVPSRVILYLSIAVLVLILLSWTMARWLAARIDRFSRQISEAACSIADGDFSTHIETVGPAREFTELGVRFNGMAASLHRRILNLRLGVRRSEELRDSSRRLIEDCINAREPVTKKHPGLATGYAQALIRNAGRRGEQSTLADGLVNRVLASETREDLRWTPDGLRLEGPGCSKLLDLSAKGMAFEGSRGLPVGSSWAFWVAGETRKVEVSGTVRWCRLSKTEKVGDESYAVYRVGLAFDQELSSEKLSLFSPPWPLHRAS